MSNQFRVRLEGRSPLVMHNNTCVDPLSPEKKKLGALTGKKSKTDADHLAIRQIEFAAGIYFDHLLGPYIPAKNLRKMLIEGARKKKQGKQFEAGIFVCDDAKLLYDGPRDLESLYEQFAWTVPAGNQSATIMRTRPKFDDWACEFEVMVETSLVGHDDLVEALKSAEIAVGICDARSLGMGRFRSQVLSAVAAEVETA